MLDLDELMKSDIKFKQIWESSCKNHRVLYVQINNEDDGIVAHFHPFGEDHALILDGELTYDISFDEQIVAKKNTLVFGWTNYVHGYHNPSAKPLHILIFATPENNLSVYEQNKLPLQKDINIRLIEWTVESEQLASKRILFSSVPPKDFSNTLRINLENKKIEYPSSEIDSNHNTLYVKFLLPLQ